MNEKQIEILKKRYNVLYDPANGKFIRTQEGLRQAYLWDTAANMVLFGAFALGVFIFSLLILAAGSAVGSYVFLLIAAFLAFLMFRNFYRFAQFYEDEKSTKVVLLQVWKYSKMDSKEVLQ